MADRSEYMDTYYVPIAINRHSVHVLGGSSRLVKRSRRGNYKFDHEKKQKGRDEVDNNSPVIQMFRECQKALDRKHDKYERIVKLSRDITIDSKRIIFQLHRISGSSQPDSVLKEAEEKLEFLRSTKWKSVAKELHTEDAYQYLRAYSPGLQEYIEAVSFWFYLKEKKLVSIEFVNQGLQYKVDENEANMEVTESVESKSEESNAITSNLKTDESTKSDEANKLIEQMFEMCVHVPPMEYMLGIADLTGELMRMAINSLGSGDLEVPFELCTFMRVIHDAFVLFGNVQRELQRKLSTLKQSLRKVETACYTLQVRGSEIPKHMLKDVFSSRTGEVPGQFDDYIDVGN